MSTQLITIYTFNYPHEAYIIKGRLESEGIICFLKDEMTIQIDNFYSNALNGVKLQVMEQDVAAATEILKEVGYKFSEDEKTSIFLLKLKNSTAKIPILNKFDFFWRLIILVTLIVSAIVVTFYFIQRKTIDELLTTYAWELDYITINNEEILDPDPKVGTGSEIFIRIGNGNLQFNTNGLLVAQFYWNDVDTALWNYEEGILTISDFKGESAFLNQNYYINVGEDLLTMQSGNLIIKAHHFMYHLKYL